jgi:hypothetical protein
MNQKHLTECLLATGNLVWNVLGVNIDLVVGPVYKKESQYSLKPKANL